MPYRPTELSAKEQAQQWYMQHPESVRRLRAQGVSGADPGLLDPANSEGNPDIVPVILDPIQDKKRRYYRHHPDQDPQSTTSKVMEFFGFDQPYRNDSRSYDYQQKKWDQSVNEGNPDMSWFLPAFNDDVQSVYEGSMPNNYGEDDPRTDAQRWQGAVDDFLSFPMLGMQDEAVAGVGALTGDGTYEDNLNRARDVEDAGMEWTPVWNRVAHNLAGLPLDAPVLIGGAALAGKGLQTAKRAAGFAPATSRLGRAAEEIATTSPAFAAEDAMWQMGNARGDLSERADQFNPNWAIAASMFPVYMGGGQLIRGLGESAWEAGSRIGKSMFGKSKKAANSASVASARANDMAPIPKDTMPAKPSKPLPPRSPEPKLIPRKPETVREDLTKAMRDSRLRDRGA